MSRGGGGDVFVILILMIKYGQLIKPTDQDEIKEKVNKLIFKIRFYS